MPDSRKARALFAISVLIGVTVSASCSISRAESDYSEERPRILVFDCYVPIPDGFILNSRETLHIALFSGAPLSATRIIISPYSSDLEEVFETISSKRNDHLTVEELRYRKSTGRAENDRVVRIHDGRQSLEVYTPTAGLVESLVDACLASRKR
jgi:hypothetical protein